MLPLLLVASLLASARVVPNADAAVYLPRLDRISDLTAFARAAGAHASLLDPPTWRGELHPLLQVDLTRPDSMAQAGIDPTGAATVNFIGQAKLTCLSVRDPARFKEGCAQRLAELGQPWREKRGGLELVGAAQNGRPVAAYALKGREACAVRSTAGSVEPSLPYLVKLVGTPEPPGDWKALSARAASAYVFTPQGSAGLVGSDHSLTAEGWTRNPSLPPLKGAGATPYAAPPGGLALMRARVDPAAAPALAQALANQVRSACRECPREALDTLAQALAGQLTGQVMLRVDSVKVGESLRGPEDRFFAVRHAYLAEVKDPKTTRALLSQLDDWKNARKTDDGYTLTGRAGELHLGLNGHHLFLGNDAAAERGALAALEHSGGRLAHGAELTVDPKGVARGLAQVSLLEVMSAPDLAALFAVGTELGPLLSFSERLTGWIDSAGEGAHRFEGRWALPSASGPGKDPANGG